MAVPLITGTARRTALLEEAARFVKAIHRSPGVMRIALIGSITTDTLEPKDIDLLVTVTDDADLQPLATAARRMQGRAQSFGAGADVFLADLRDAYLGRTCPWKECWPGRRQSCDAQHCGQRPHLHDDLRTLTLKAELIAAPPVELYPRVASRQPVPPDVEALLASLGG